jgi:drug/metabolite transporter (DMT)-like permease
VKLGLGMVAFGSATPVSKIVTEAMPVFVASTLRVVLGGLVLVPVVLRGSGRLRELGRREWLLTAWIAVFGMFGFSVLMLYGMRLVPGVVGAIVMSTTPAVTAAGSMLFLGDRPTVPKLAAILLAVLGVLILHLGQEGDAGSGEAGENLLLGSLLVFGAVCCEAVYTLLGKKVSASIDPVLVASLAALLSTPLFLPFAAWQWHEFSAREVDAPAWTALLWYGAGTLALGTWLWYSGLRKTEGAVAAGFMGLMPASALVLSYLLLGEAFRWRHLAGFAVVLAGVLLISREHARMAEGREGEEESTQADPPGGG